MKLSFRIIVPRYEKEEYFQQLLAFLLEYEDCIDEIALFTEYWHRYPASCMDGESSTAIVEHHITFGAPFLCSCSRIDLPGTPEAMPGTHGEVDTSLSTFRFVHKPKVELLTKYQLIKYNNKRITNNNT